MTCFNRFSYVSTMRMQRIKNKLKRKQDLLTKNLKLNHLQTVRHGYPYKWEWPKWLAKPKYCFSLRLR